MKLGSWAAIFAITMLALALQPTAQARLNPGVASSCSNVNVAPYSIFNLIGYSLLGLVISIDVVAIGYILGRIIPSTGIRKAMRKGMEKSRTSFMFFEYVSQESSRSDGIGSISNECAG